MQPEPHEYTEEELERFEDTTNVLDLRLRTAEWFIERGHAVIPAKPRQKSPFWKEWNTQPGLTYGRAYDHIGRGFNLGLSTNMSSVDVVDVDSYKGRVPRFLFDAHTVVARSPRGGYHFYFQDDPERPLETAEGAWVPWIDLRAKGRGFIVLPGSVTKHGAYYWEPGCAPWEREIQARPDELNDPAIKSYTRREIVREAKSRAELVRDYNVFVRKWTGAVLQGEGGEAMNTGRTVRLKRLAFLLGTYKPISGASDQQIEKYIVTLAHQLNYFDDHPEADLRREIEGALAAASFNTVKASD